MTSQRPVAPSRIDLAHAERHHHLHPHHHRVRAVCLRRNRAADIRRPRSPCTLTRSLAAEGKFIAFPIQAATLPDTLQGRDVLGRGKTGSGKTIAFALPLVARLGESGAERKPRRPRALVLAPTRELATQIDAVIAPLAETYGMTTATIFGGVSQKPQEKALNRGVDIVVACPGRLEDLLKQGVLNLDSAAVTVLDEADHMADLGFLPGVTRILGQTPADAQRLFFSATLDNGVDKLVKRFLTDPCTTPWTRRRATSPP